MGAGRLATFGNNYGLRQHAVGWADRSATNPHFSLGRCIGANPTPCLSISLCLIKPAAAHPIRKCPLSESGEICRDDLFGSIAEIGTSGSNVRSSVVSIRNPMVGFRPDQAIRWTSRFLLLS